MARLTGHHATLYFGSASGLSDYSTGTDGFNWEINIESDAEESMGWADTWAQNAPLGGRWSGRMEAYTTTWELLDLLVDRIVDKANIFVEFHEGSTGTATGAKCAEGQIVLTGASGNAPMGNSTQTIEFVGNGALTVTA